MPFEDMALYLSVPDAVVIDPTDYAMLNCLTGKLAASGQGSPPVWSVRASPQCMRTVPDFEISKGH